MVSPLRLLLTAVTSTTIVTKTRHPVISELKLAYQNWIVVRCVDRLDMATSSSLSPSTAIRSIAVRLGLPAFEVTESHVESTTFPPSSPADLLELERLSASSQPADSPTLSNGTCTCARYTPNPWQSRADQTPSTVDLDAVRVKVTLNLPHEWCQGRSALHTVVLDHRFCRPAECQCDNPQESCPFTAAGTPVKTAKALMGHMLQLLLRKSGILGTLLLALLPLGLWRKETRESKLSHSGGDPVQPLQANAGQADQALPLPASSMPAVPGDHTRMIAITDVEGSPTVQVPNSVGTERCTDSAVPREALADEDVDLASTLNVSALQLQVSSQIGQSAAFTSYREEGKISSKLDIADATQCFDIWDISFTEEGYPEWCTTATALSSGSETGDLSSLFMGSPLPVSSPIREDINNEENKHCDCCVKVARGRGKNLPTFEEVATDDRDVLDSSFCSLLAYYHGDEENETLDEPGAEDLLDAESEAEESSVSCESYSSYPKTSEPGHGDHDICDIDGAETLMVSVPPVDSLENLSPLSDLSTKRLRSVASFSPSLATSLTFDELGTLGPREDEGRGGHQQCQRASGEPSTSTALLAL